MSIADDEIDMNEFADTMTAIVDQLLLDQSKADWEHYGFLPSTRTLYALYRRAGGRVFRNADDFVDALLEVRVELETRNGVGHPSQYMPMFGGERWVDIIAMAMNCIGKDATDERRTYFYAVLTLVMDEAKTRKQMYADKIQGLHALANAVENGALTEPMVSHIMREFGLSSSGTLQPGEMLFENEHLVDGGNAE